MIKGLFGVNGKGKVKFDCVPDQYKTLVLLGQVYYIMIKHFMHLKKGYDERKSL
ncbi:hypothetical protein KFK09_008416 [Dendrobium nobile]|uniref:Uncharacterized protein n=1 Tax=Dendrobium nobile TaxID=94219 RepID=A0A8T3BMP2_DENNO|nr:hypothetical protein KFK09_008416 [Dendrobium nobile]